MRKAILATAFIGLLAVGVAIGATQGDTIKAAINKNNTVPQSQPLLAAETDNAQVTQALAGEPAKAVDVLTGGVQQTAANDTTVPEQQETTTTVATTEEAVTEPVTTTVQANDAAGGMTPVDLSSGAALNDQAPAAGDEQAAEDEEGAGEEVDAVSTDPRLKAVAASSPKPNMPERQVIPSTGYKVDVEKSLENRSLGSADAPLTVHDFSSLTCPHCAHFHKELLPKIKERYIDTGKVRWVFHPFPLNQAAMKADMVARCAPNDQYLKLRDFMFENQEKWAFSEESLANLNMLLKVAGITDDIFFACANNQDLEVGLAKQAQESSKKYKINATPSFVFNDGMKSFSGVGSFEGFAYDIDHALEDLQKPAAPQSTPAPAAQSTPAPAAK